jgi:tetratricopeptide (TPR) repeat protein
MRVVEIDQRNVQAWYWLSRVVETPREREICLENVLALDPAHMAVQAELAELRYQMAEAERKSMLSKEAIAAAIPQTAEERLISEAAVEPLACPYCGTVTGVDDRQCSLCGHALYVRQPKSKTHSVYSLLLVLIWFAQANYLFLGLTVYYLFSDLSSSPDVQTVSDLLGIEGVGVSLLTVPLTPVLLVGGVSFLFSLFVAWGLWRRWTVFYWLTVALLLLGLPVLVFQAVVVEMSLAGLALGGVFWLSALGVAFMAYEEFQWVEHRLSATLDKDVDSPSSLYARGRELAEQGMWAKAAIHWSKAVALSPGHPDYRVALASAYINLGQVDRAWEHLQMAQQIEPGHPQLAALAAQARGTE